MADRNLAFRITARDEASSVFTKMARAAKSELGKAEGALDDVGSAGKQMAREMSRAADDLADELDRTERAADELARALGPEFASKVNDGDIDRMVVEFRKAGLTFEDIEADADELAASIKRLDEVAQRAGSSTRRSFDDVSDAARRAGDTTEKTRSVTANYAGNAAQDLPGVADSFGAVNVAVGQFAEYATEGDIAFKNLVKAGLGMAAVTAVIQGLTGAMERQAKADAFEADKVRDWAEALRDGERVVSIIRKEVEDTGRLEFRIFDSMVDAVPVIDAAGLSVESFSRLVEGGTDTVNEWAAAQREAGTDAETIGMTVAVAGEFIDRYGASQEGAAATARVLGEQLEENEGSFDRLSAAVQRNKDRIDERNQAILAMADSDLAARMAADEAVDALTNYNDVLADGESTAEDREDAEFQLEQAYLNAAAAAGRSAEDQARASGRASTAQSEGVTAQINSLSLLAGSLDPNSPLRNRIEDYINQLYRIPRNVGTEVTFTNRTGTGVGVQRRAHGGPVSAGQPYLVGEKGPELVVPAASGTVIPNGATVGGGPIIVQVVLGDRVVTEALVRDQRRNGPIPIRVAG